MVKKLFLTAVAVICLIIISVLVIRKNEEGKMPETANEKVAYILQNRGCLDCHQQNPRKPFYEELPVIGGLLQIHKTRGVNYFDLGAMLNSLQNDGVCSEVEMAKLERAILNNSMPIFEYKMMHWMSALSSNEKAIILAWAADLRKEQFASQDVAEEFINEPVRPLPTALSVDSAKAALGFDLYHDTRLSKNNTVSCATCHPLDKAGVDGTRTSKGIYDQWGGINAPTVYNAALNFVQFWDGRTPDLQAQIHQGPPLDPMEMGSSWEEICGKISEDKAMVERFKAVYEDGVTGINIANAIAEFEKTLLTPNCKFDRYLKGEKEILSDEEIAGYELFKQKNCATCHAGENFGGLSFEKMGIVGDYIGERTAVAFHDKDLGRIGVTQAEYDRYRFKVPTLRNIALTAPYLHDGTAATLEEAVEAMFKYQTGAKYTQQDVDLLVKFMNTLTGENQYLK